MESVNTRFILECRNPHTEFDVLQTLLDNGADIHFEKEWPLVCACSYNRPDVVEFLLRNKARLFVADYLPFTSACLYDNILVVKYLFPFVPREIRVRGFHLACGKGHLKLVRFFLANRFYARMRNNSPLRHALSGSIEVIQLLLDSGATISESIYTLAMKESKFQIAEFVNFKKHEMMLQSS